MNTNDLSIPEPCNADWNAMSGDERQRFCGACSKHVTDISTFTKREAESFLDANPSACVQYTKVGEEILFEPAVRTSATFRRPRALLRRVAQVAAVAAVTSAPAMASSSVEEAGSSLVEWVASWFVEPVVVLGEVSRVEPVEPLDTGLAPEPVVVSPSTSLIPEVDEPISTPHKPVVQVKGKIKSPPVRTLLGRPVRRDRK